MPCCDSVVDWAQLGDSPAAASRWWLGLESTQCRTGLGSHADGIFTRVWGSWTAEGLLSIAVSALPSSIPVASSHRAPLDALTAAGLWEARPLPWCVAFPWQSLLRTTVEAWWILVVLLLPHLLACSGRSSAVWEGMYKDVNARGKIQKRRFRFAEILTRAWSHNWWCRNVNTAGADFGIVLSPCPL